MTVVEEESENEDLCTATILSQYPLSQILTKHPFYEII